MYINDIEINFVKENCPSVDIQRISIFLLMYADDMVLIARIEENWVTLKIGHTMVKYYMDIVSEFNYFGVLMILKEIFQNPETCC